MRAAARGARAPSAPPGRRAVVVPPASRTIAHIEPQEIRETLKLTLPIDVSDPDVPRQKFVYQLVGEVPEGARVDAETGVFEWRPADDANPAAYFFPA